MDRRSLLRNTLLAGTLAFGLASVVKADEPRPNVNNLPTSCAIPEREIIRHAIDTAGVEHTYTTFLGGKVAEALVVTRTEDPFVTVGQPYRVPLGPEDRVEFAAEDAPSAFSNVRRAPTPITTGVSSVSKGSPLYVAAQDRWIDGDELPAGVNTASVSFWTTQRYYDWDTHLDTDCSVRFPISVYRAEAMRSPTERTSSTATTPSTSDVRQDAVPIGARIIDGSQTPATNVRDAAVAPIKEFTILGRKGADQYTFRDSRGSSYAPLDFDITQLAVRYRYMGARTKFDLQGALTSGDDGAGLKLSAFDVEALVDRKVMGDHIALGISAAAGYKDVRTYLDVAPGYALEDSRQANGYGYLGVNLAFTGDDGFASGDWLVLRAGAVAQPIIDKHASFGNDAYASTTDLEIAPEISADARWSFTDRTWLDIQARYGLDVQTAYTSPNTDRELTRSSDYKNVTLGIGHLFGDAKRHGLVGQLKWADNGESWTGLRDTLGRTYDGQGFHEGLAVGLGYAFRWK